jgi:uncharacterized protein YebE (UPF0316 family)
MFNSAALLGALLIFCAKVIDVSIGSMRLILLTRGKKYVAGALGFIESIVYIVALGFVVARLDNPLNIVMYGLGFACGNIVGSYIEERMAVGFLTVQVISVSGAGELCKSLRDIGYGVTSWEGEGREGIHSVLSITVARKELPRLMKIIDEWDSHAFVTILDARNTKGGVIYKVRQKQK